MRIKQIYPGLFLYTFPNQFELCSTFFRLQEYFESPIRKIRNKYFTYEQAITYYAYDNKENPEFTYFKDWTGFNVPGNVVKKFILAFKDDLTNKEKRILNKLEIYNRLKECDFYLIGVIKGEEDTTKHEIAHGLYYLNKVYKKEMNKLLKQLPKRVTKVFKNKLKELGYCKQVMNDEIHAYITTGIREGMMSTLDKIIYYKLIKKFKKTFEKYYKEIKNER